MKSTICSSFLVVGLFFASQQAGARMTTTMVERSLSDSAHLVDGHLHILTKKDAANISPKKHRRHHSRKVKRGTCNSSSSSSSSSGDDSTDVGSGDASQRKGYGTTSTSSSDTAASTSRKSSSTSGSSSSGSSSSSSSSGSSTDTSSSSSSDDSSDDVSPATSGSSGSASALGSISGFQGTNTGIGSWFRTNSGQDSTNGRSWCQLNYQDSWLGFAPSVGTMLKNFGGDTNTAGKAYCGRQARATAPNGKTALIYVVDGFDDKWVLTPGSIDLTIGAFEALYGSFDGNKNTVIKDLKWEWTGEVNQEYTFNANGKM